MKKLVNKIRRKPEQEESTRITTETIAEHREKVLAGGRRFKYPVQYARHKLVFNAILIGVAVIILFIVFLWWQLYSVQNTSDFMYRVTKVLPVSVARIDGERVRYSDYLMKYRSSIHYLQEKEQVNLNSEDGKRQSDFVKQQAMEDALADAYAMKLAKENGVAVTDADLETFLQQQRNSADGQVSQRTYDAVILDYYGWSPEEYRHAMKAKLLRQKVAYVVDKQAEATADRIAELVTGNNVNLKSIAAKINSEEGAQVTFAAQGWVPANNQDGGLAVAAAALKKGSVSSVIASTNGDGYYFVKLVDRNDTQVNYEYIHIPLTAFEEQLQAIRNADTTKVHITIPEVAAVQQ